MEDRIKERFSPVTLEETLRQYSVSPTAIKAWAAAWRGISTWGQDLLPSYPALCAGDALGEALVLEDAGRFPRPEGVPPLAGRPRGRGLRAE